MIYPPISNNQSLNEIFSKIDARVLSKEEWNTISNEIIKLFTTDKSLKDLHIDLCFNHISNEGTIAIAKALASGNCPQGLQIDLRFNYISDVGIIAIAKALASGNCPQGLQIDLSGNKISDEGIIAIAKALTSGHCPQGLQIDLSGNKISDVGIIAIAQALTSGNYPKGLHIDLRNNFLGNKGAIAIAEAFASGHCPQGLQIDLSGNNSIDDKGTLALRQAQTVQREEENLRKQVALTFLCALHNRCGANSPLQIITPDTMQKIAKMLFFPPYTKISRSNDANDAPELPKDAPELPKDAPELHNNILDGTAKNRCIIL